MHEQYEQIKRRGIAIQSYTSADVYSRLSSIRGVTEDDNTINAIGQQFLPGRMYVPRDIITALNSVLVAAGVSKTLDAVAAAFDLRRDPQYDMPRPQIMIEAPPVRRLLR